MVGDAGSPSQKNLRNTLPNLKALVGPHLMITRQALALNRDSACEVDVEQFCTVLTASQPSADLEVLRDATALYRDDFLAGFYVREAPAFEDWATIEREHLRTIAIEGLLTLVENALEQGAYEFGLEATRRLLTLDPWRETAHQHRMRLLAYTGQRGAALAQYDTCRQVMDEELGVEPMADTTALYEQIKAGALAMPPPKAIATALPRRAAEVDWSDFPKRTPFYGRHDELATLRHWLLDEQACLVGLFGIGGQGKTALAAELAWSLIDESQAQPKAPDSSQANGAFDRILWRSLVNAPP
ncbi:AfsR/SARP family transcriptional regulator, partial [Candidatus Entotheonella palauensis]|uniref:AfsR/SARP family transcriptional regulator n=1 Tax=Candidatus Entotheonella palauensis TaxID=93172 RepID=UPI001C4DE3FA